MLTLKPRDGLDRAELIESLRQRISTHGFPRTQMLFIVGVAGGAAFLCSVLTLRAGLSQMGLRYGLSAFVGYLAFLSMVRLWIAWQRGRWEGPDLEPVDVVDAANAFAPDLAGPRPGALLFRGGRSGGGGGSASWSDNTAAAVERTGTAKSAWSIDFDDGWPIVIAVACAGFGVIAIGYTIWIAPALLAEVALDAALVTALYRKLRKEEAGTWIGATLRRTWIAAAAVVLLMTIAGYAMAYAAPDAKSIGGVVEVFRARQTK